MIGVTLALPAYNESANLIKVLENSVNSLESLGETWEILVIDNHSSDDTSELARSFARSEPRIRVIQHDENPLYSGSCATAMRESRGRRVAIMDSDGQVLASDLSIFLEKLDQGANLVLGWRRQRNDPRPRLLMSWVFNVMGSHYIKFPFHDLNCGYRMFDRTFIEAADIRYRFNLSNPELFVRARLAGLNVEEVAVTHWAREGGETSHDLRRSWKIFRDVNRYLADLGAEMKTATVPENGQ